MADTELTGANAQAVADKKSATIALVKKVAIIVVVIVVVLWLVKKFIR